MKKLAHNTRRAIQMIKNEVNSSLKRGTGQAILLALKFPDMDFSKAIIQCCIKNHAYDGQCESSRAQYLFEIIKLSKNQMKIRSAILARLKNERTDTWSLTQLFDLAKMYAKNGDHEAKSAIYDRFCNEPIQGSEWVGYDAIFELDGLDGLKFIAERTGKWLVEKKEKWQDDMILSSFEYAYPKINARNELKKFSRQNEYIKIYLNRMKQTDDNRKKQKRKPFLTYDNHIDEILNNQHTFLVLRKVKLTKAELKSIANLLQIEKDIIKKERLLSVFTKYKYPLNSNDILALARLREKPNQRIVEFAIDSLRNLKGDSIRRFALERLPKTRNPSIFTNILISNYKSGDANFLSQLADKFNNLDIIEELACSYLEIFKNNKTKECKKPLEIIYNKMNCGIHRNSIVQALVNNNVLSDRIRMEIEYDSYEKTRKLLKKLKSKRVKS